MVKEELIVEYSSLEIVFVFFMNILGVDLLIHIKNPALDRLGFLAV